jgi:chromosome segregation ATPase
MRNGVLIPNELAACQALLAELTRGIAVDPSATDSGLVEQHLLTIKSHEEQIKSHEQTIKAHELTIATHALTITSLSDRLEKLQQENAEQKVTIDELLRRAFAKRSERYLENPDQLRLDFRGTAAEEAAADAAESLAEALAQADAASDIVVPEHTRRKHRERKPRSEQLPAHLPRYEVEAPIADDAKSCPTRDAGVRASETEGPSHADPEVRLREIARMRRF